MLRGRTNGTERTLKASGRTGTERGRGTEKRQGERGRQGRRENNKLGEIERGRLGRQGERRGRERKGSQQSGR
jgi:hypothetical protein